MANTHIHRFDGLSRSKGCSYDLTAVNEGLVSASCFGEVCMLSNQDAFSAADRWPAGDNAHVAGYAESAWMRQAVTVAHKQIRLLLQFPQHVEQCRCFSKGKQARHVWEFQIAEQSVLFNDFMITDIP